MDGPRFDRLARSLAGAGSRRRFLGGLLGLGAGLAGSSAAGAACPNRLCAADPAVCGGTPGCVCCVFAHRRGGHR